MYEVWWSDRNHNWFSSQMAFSLDQARCLFKSLGGEQGLAQVRDLTTDRVVDIQLLLREEESVNWQKEGF